MSAALNFALDPPVDQSRCGFPKCTGKAFHEGGHQFPAPGPIVPQRVYTCRECGIKFVVYGSQSHENYRICDSQACLVALCHREAANIPLACPCGQRSYPHELAVHTKLRTEGRRNRWPWSLMLASRVEPSTEREAA